MTNPTALSRLLAALADPATTKDLDQEQWSGVVSGARSANLLGALGERFRGAGLGEGSQAQRHLDGARQLSVRQRRSVLWEAHQLQLVLGQLEVPVVLLKGAAYVLADLANAQGRLFGDIDILVPRDALGDVESRLLLHGWISATASAYDQRYYRQWMHELPPMVHMRRGTVIDVHHTILPLTARNAPDPNQIISRSVPVTVPGLSALRTPCPEDLVIHSITHLVHEGDLHNGLRDLNDIDSLVRAFAGIPGFWTRLAGFAAGNDLALPVCFGLHLVRRLFDTPVPDTVLAALSPTRLAMQPAPWLEAIYLRALPPRYPNGRADIGWNMAHWMVYLRSHSLRMPWPLLARHLAVKAWLGWRASFGQPASS